MDDTCCVVMVTVGDPDEAQRIASDVVKEHLAACCNMIPGVSSVFRWQGQVCREKEILLLMKTPRAKFEALRQRVLELHSYDVPEVIALPIEKGHTPYLDWVRVETNP